MDDVQWRRHMRQGSRLSSNGLPAACQNFLVLQRQVLWFAFAEEDIFLQALVNSSVYTAQNLLHARQN